MTELLNRAFEAARKLSAEDQDALGSELLERISADARWEELFADPRSRTFFGRMAAEVRADIAAGEVDDGDPGSKSRLGPGGDGTQEQVEPRLPPGEQISGKTRSKA